MCSRESRSRISIRRTVSEGVGHIGDTATVWSTSVAEVEHFPSEKLFVALRFRGRPYRETRLSMHTEALIACRNRSRQ